LNGSKEFTHIPLMRSVVQNCPLIQELEIMGVDYEPGPEQSSQEMSAIAQLRDLKRLTLTNLRVENGLFLEEVKNHFKSLKSILI